MTFTLHVISATRMTDVIQLLNNTPYFFPSTNEIGAFGSRRKNRAFFVV